MFKNKKMDTKGMWKRTFSVFRGVSVPWFLYLLEIILGICSTKVALLYVPYQTKVKMGQFENGSAVWLYIGYALLAVVVGVINSVITFYAQEIVSRNMKNRMISHSLRMPLREIEKAPDTTLFRSRQDHFLDK